MTHFSFFSVSYSSQRFQSVCASDEYKDLPSVAVNQTLSFEGVKASVSALKQQVEDFCKKEVIKISEEGLGIKFPIC